jgi:hypothetical protein
MGGALATLFAYELAQQKWDKVPFPAFLSSEFS